MKFVVPPNSQAQTHKKAMQKELFDAATLLGPSSASKLQNASQVAQLPQQHGFGGGVAPVQKERRSYSLTTKKETRKSSSKKRDVEGGGAQMFSFAKKGESPVRKKTSALQQHQQQPVFSSGGGVAFVGGIGRTALAVGYPKG